MAKIYPEPTTRYQDVKRVKVLYFGLPWRGGESGRLGVTGTVVFASGNRAFINFEKRGSCWRYKPATNTERIYCWCSSADVPYTLRVMMFKAMNTGDIPSGYKHIHKDERVSEEVASIARGCFLDKEYFALSDVLAERGLPKLPDTALTDARCRPYAAALARYDWPWGYDGYSRSSR